MPKVASPTSLAGGAALLCLVAIAAAVTFVARSHHRAPVDPAATAYDGCLNERDRQRARTLAHLAFMTAHPTPGKVVEEGAGCDQASGEVFASREYYWALLDTRQVITFYQELAADDGWQPWPVSGSPNPAELEVDSATQGLKTGLCLTKQVDGNRAFLELYFQDSSVHGPAGDVYDVIAWWPGPREPLGC
ncbi:hypothetical protein COUCH_26525 [Couchioplanes caeruleus]|uniref:hypothetical protein n=1 Tax=Couchioplanes caeruleus TaxID=56438 RepID=UPI0020C00FDD|nr:hypothetical protein [Couchioplanes caeruleus]UQU62572.1 hypothetical protein COUCH_26525 [Couchioplanes caeruleus]